MIRNRRWLSVSLVGLLCFAAWSSNRQIAKAAESSASNSIAQKILDTAGISGGLIVHLGCGDGQLTAALRVNDSYLVQGLDNDADLIASAQKQIARAGLYGKVSVDLFTGGRLPYTENLVNLLVISDTKIEVPDSEITRVLCPGGVAVRIAPESPDAKPEIIVEKPWPRAMDEWTHYHHNPQGTMVGGDTALGPPRRIQWQAGPKWLRNHDFMSSMHAMVSTGGRIFYVMDEGLRKHIFLPARWTLIARDAFNGTVLWKQPLADWHPNNWPLKSGPGHYPRKLVAVDDRVYVAAGLTEPVRVYDAASGELIQTYEDTKPTQEILLADDVLYLLVDPDIPPVGYTAESTGYKEIGRASSGWAWKPEHPKRIVTAIEADSGRVLWKQTTPVAPLTLTVGVDRVFYHNGTSMIAVDRATGKELWTTTGPSIKSVPTGGTLRVVYTDGVLLFAAGTKLSAFDANDGSLLWNGSLMKTSHHCPEDLFVIDGVIWSVNTGKPQEGGTHFKVMDLKTGEILKDFVAKNLPGFPMHPRCYPSRATTKYIMTNGMGTEFYRVGDDRVDINNFVRGSCIYGIMPSNGMMYKPPDSCACYYQSKLEYFCALAPKSPEAEPITPEAERLIKGPAYKKVTNGKASTDSPADWPMYRRDATRSGFNPAPLSADLKPAWKVELGGKLTQPVIVGGKVFVAAVDRHTLYAIDSESGTIAWQFTAGGRIDSAPTLLDGTVLFGSADGGLYCLDAADGQLAWRYQVAQGIKRIVSYDQVESAWPVSGSVIVNDGVVYALAGRNMFFDGGLRLVRLDAKTGRLISENIMDENDPETGKNLQTLIAKKYMPTANVDILSCDGEHVYMQSQKFTLEGKRLGISPADRDAQGSKHLFCQTGLLDDVWYHRSYWIYGATCGEGWGAYANSRKSNPCGRIMVLDDTRAYAFRSDPLGNMLHPRTTYTLYACDKESTAAAVPSADDRKRARRGEKSSAAKIGSLKVHWQLESLPLLVNAMTLCGENLFIAGPPDVADETAMLGFLPGRDDDINRQLAEQNAAWLGKRGGLLWVVSAVDGRKLAQYELESFPAFDGMSAGGDALYFSQIDGSIVKYEAKDKGNP